MSYSSKISELGITEVDAPELGSHYHYAIIEQTLFEDLLIFIYQLPVVPQWCYLFKQTDYEENASNGPTLFEVETVEVMALIAKRFEEGFSGAFISSVNAFDVLQPQLQRALTIKKQSGNRALSRFYDPRVLTGLLGSLSQNEVVQYLGPLATIQWYAYSHWLQFTASKPFEKPIEQVPIFMLSDEKIKRMDAIRQWEIKQYLITRYASFVESPNITTLIFNDAENHGAQSARELESYLRLRITINSLHSEPEWLTRIMQNNESPFLSRVNMAQDSAQQKDM